MCNMFSLQLTSTLEYGYVVVPCAVYAYSRNHNLQTISSTSNVRKHVRLLFSSVNKRAVYKSCPREPLAGHCEMHWLEDKTSITDKQ